MNQPAIKAPTTAITASSRHNFVARNISYGDSRAQLLLWQKAFLLIPIWGVLVVPIVGLVCRMIGNTAVQFGYGIVLCVFAAYFCEDLLKRRIRLDDEYIYFGFKALPIRDVVSIDIKYKKSKFLPGNLVIYRASGKTLKLSLSGLTDESVDLLVKHLQSRNSSIKIAPVLTAMVKCRRIKPVPLETPDRLELPYHSRRLIFETIDAFKESAKKWMRIGPLLTCIVCGPLWMTFMSSLYVMLQPVSWTQIQQLSLHQFLMKFFEAMQQFLMNTAGKTTEAVQHFSQNGIVLGLMCVSILAIISYLLRFLWRPNILVADVRGVKIMMRLAEICIPFASVQWSDIGKMKLQTGGSSSGSLLIEKKNGKKFVIDLSALAAEDKGVLLRRMEKSVPDCVIDHELSQSMLPNSEHSYTEIWLQSLNQSPERSTLEPLEPGQVVGDNRFEVLQSLGVGGQGTAYLCRQMLNREADTIVLKETILPIFADTNLRRRALEKFDQEARLLKELDNPGIVRLIDYFVEDHRAYLMLEHVKGCNLRELVLRDGPLDQERVRDLALQMCAVLKFLHENSVVHRDFTPDNLILNSDGKLKLIDFNVAQQIQSGATGTIVGKHAYLPPEQFRGKATAQSDLYAFGATLYYLLTGLDPEPISQSSPASKDASIDPAFDRIIKRSTALQTNARYQNADEIEADIRAWVLSSLEEPVLLQATNSAGSPQTVSTHSQDEVKVHG